MADQEELYIPRNPGDLITAEDWNSLQTKIKEDIGNQITEEIGKIETVSSSENSSKLEGKTLDEIKNEIIERALQEIPTRTGYLKIFKQLKVGEESVIEHGLKTCPLVDVYQLDYFEVVCAHDEEEPYKHWVTFYLYHTSEKKIRYKENGTTTVEIELMDSHPYKIPFKDMLEHYNVKYTDDSSLGDLETEFWKAFFVEPNDYFDPEQYCHSAWFERCCREERTVKSLKDRGDWDDLWFQMRPRKTINYPEGSPSPAPTQIQVAHFDFDTIAVKLLTIPVYPADLPVAIKNKRELKVMLLLKV